MFGMVANGSVQQWDRIEAAAFRNTAKYIELLNCADRAKQIFIHIHNALIYIEGFQKIYCKNSSKNRKNSKKIYLYQPKAKMLNIIAIFYSLWKLVIKLY